MFSIRAPPVTARITLCKPVTMADNWSNKQEDGMPVIDVQVHPFDRNHPGRPWASPSHGLDSATGEEMVAAMNSVGVDGAIMVSSFSAYEYDPSYALEVYRNTSSCIVTCTEMAGISASSLLLRVAATVRSLIPLRTLRA